MNEALQQITFGKGGNADTCVGAGWSAGENGFRWMTDEVSDLWLDCPRDGPLLISMDVHPLVRPPVLPAQHIFIRVGDVEVYRAALTEPTTFDFSIPTVALTDAGKIHLAIHHPDAASPSDLVGSSDRRRLACSVRELRMCRNLAPNAKIAGVEQGAPAVVGIAKRQITAFVGNCQMKALSTLYRRLLGQESDRDVIYVASYNEASEGDKRAVADAAVMVQQVLDFAPRVGDLPTRGKVHLVPHITAAFLWPYSGTPHPLNRSEPLIEHSGPYNAELGDSFLNRMISAGMSPELAVAEYLATDVPALRRIDRMKELHLDKQRDRDAACGFNVADHIEAGFRTTQLFRSPNHPETALALWFGAEVFRRMGEEEAAITSLFADPPPVFPATETPVHPAVARHFGLTYAGPDRRYHFFNEGDFTFEEYAYRYMRYEWNVLLAEGLDLLRQQNIVDGVEKLRMSLAAAPRSAIARMALADALEKLDRPQEAAEYACQAVEIEPENARYVERLRQISERAHLRRASLAVTPSVSA